MSGRSLPQAVPPDQAAVPGATSFAEHVSHIQTRHEVSESCPCRRYDRANYAEVRHDGLCGAKARLRGRSGARFRFLVDDGFQCLPIEEEGGSNRPQTHRLVFVSSSARVEVSLALSFAGEETIYTRVESFAGTFEFGPATARGPGDAEGSCSPGGASERVAAQSIRALSARTRSGRASRFRERHVAQRRRSALRSGLTHGRAAVPSAKTRRWPRRSICGPG
jgi:hypothetical protein